MDNGPTMYQSKMTIRFPSAYFFRDWAPIGFIGYPRHCFLPGAGANRLYWLPPALFSLGGGLQ